MKEKVLISLTILTILSILILPQENKLGESYKLIYIHVPVTVIMISSLLLFPILQFKIQEEQAKSLSVSILAFSAFHITISSMFMLLTWGGLAFTEIRFIFSITIFFFALTHALLSYIDLRLAKLYSFLIYIITPYFYIQISKAEFQLHPTFVEMPAYFYIPYLVSFPLMLMIYGVIYERIKKQTQTYLISDKARVFD